MASLDLNQVSVEVDLLKVLHQFRHASELTNEAKGGYLNGSIRIVGLSHSAVVEEIILDLVSNCEEELHPAVLYITPRERKERKTGRKGPTVAKNPAMQNEDCRVKLCITGDRAFVRHSYIKDGLDISDCWNSETRTLDLGNDKLQLTVVKPKQKGESNSKNELFVESVLLEKTRLTSKPKPNLTDFTATRGKYEPRQTSLFKAFFSAEIIYNFGDGIKRTVTGVSSQPVFDKGKYDFREQFDEAFLPCLTVLAKKILPKIICDGRPYQITVLMDTLKTTGDIPIDFQLEHIKTKRSIALRKKEKCHGHFELEFDQVPFAGICHLNLSIIEANVIVPESFQYFELKVKEHAESGCYHCEEADTPSGPIKPTKRHNDDDYLVNHVPWAKRRASDQRHSSGEQFYNSVVNEIDISSPDSGFNPSPGRSSSGYDFSNSPKLYPLLDGDTTQEIVFGQQLLAEQSQCPETVSSLNETNVESFDDAEVFDRWYKENESEFDEIIAVVERSVGDISSSNEDPVMNEFITDDDEYEGSTCALYNDPMWSSANTLYIPVTQEESMLKSPNIPSALLTLEPQMETSRNSAVAECLLNKTAPSTTPKKFNIASMASLGAVRRSERRQVDVMYHAKAISTSRPVPASGELPEITNIEDLTSGIPDNLIFESRIDSDGLRSSAVEQRRASRERARSLVKTSRGRNKSRSQSAQLPSNSGPSPWVIIVALIAVFIAAFVFRYWPWFSSWFTK